MGQYDREKDLGRCLEILKDLGREISLEVFYNQNLRVLASDDYLRTVVDPKRDEGERVWYRKTSAEERKAREEEDYDDDPFPWGP